MHDVCSGIACNALADMVSCWFIAIGILPNTHVVSEFMLATYVYMTSASKWRATRREVTLLGQGDWA